LVLHG